MSTGVGLILTNNKKANNKYIMDHAHFMKRYKHFIG